MKRPNTICLTQPLRGVRRLMEVPRQEWDELLREREEAACERGRREGEKGLSEQLIQQRAEIAEFQHGILDSLRRAIPQVVQETETALLRLALEAAQKIVAGLPVNVELVEAVVREALSQVEDGTEIIVRIHPEDLALLRKHESALLAGPSEAGPLRFVASAEVARGGCLVQTRFGMIDARQATKFGQLKETLSL
jgi:flagellar assembly protein FliH